MAIPTARGAGGNRLLGALPRNEYERLLPHLQTINMECRASAYEPDEPIQHVYFPLSGVYSIVLILEDSRAVEVATVGNEGMVGLPTFLEADSAPARAFCQIPGVALRMNAAEFREAVTRGGPLLHLLYRYTHALLNQIAQSAACNRVHPIEHRCSRWLLMTHDRMGTNEFSLTHEFLAEMLGVRRATVTVVLGRLQQAGLIRSHRGTITVRDRRGLEARACQCYPVIKREFDRLAG